MILGIIGVSLIAIGLVGFAIKIRSQEKALKREISLGEARFRSLTRISEDLDKLKQHTEDEIWEVRSPAKFKKGDKANANLSLGGSYMLRGLPEPVTILSVSSKCSHSGLRWWEYKVVDEKADMHDVKEDSLSAIPDVKAEPEGELERVMRIYSQTGHWSFVSPQDTVEEMSLKELLGKLEASQEEIKKKKKRSGGKRKSAKKK